MIAQFQQSNVLRPFLKPIRGKNTGRNLFLDNVRADLLDEEMVRLYVRAGGLNICLGTESGDPDVFKAIHKGESLERIVTAVEIIRNTTLCSVFALLLASPRYGGPFQGIPATGQTAEAGLCLLEYVHSMAGDRGAPLV